MWKKFVINNIICSYGVPFELISDQGSHLRKKLASLLEKYKIQHNKLPPYRPQTNGAMATTNKNIQRTIEKIAENYKDWLDKLTSAL